MRLLKILAILAGALLAAPLAAQTQSRGNNAPPEERLVVSPGGVDMRSGRYAYNQTDLAIGGEAGALALARTLAQPVAGHVNPFGNFSHSWDVLVSEKRVDIFHYNFVNAPGHPDYQIEVTFGGRSQTFRAAGNQISNELASRAGYGILEYSGTRANAAYAYTAGDGTIALFRPIDSADCSTILRCAYVSRITDPDGTVLNFDYDQTNGTNTARLRSVTSSRGYALLLEYSGQLVVKACVLNLALQTKPANNICPAGAQATASYGYTSFGGQQRLASATDPANAAWTFSYGGAPALFTMGFTRPGDAAPWLTNTVYPHIDNDNLVQEVVQSQSFADGTSYTYNFDSTPDVLCQIPAVIPSIAGGSYTDNLGRTTEVRYDFPVIPYNPADGHGEVGDCNGDDPPSLYVHQVTPGPVRIVDPLGRTTVIDYCDPQAMAGLPPNWHFRCFVSPMPVSVTDPEGIKTNLVSDFVARNVLSRTQIAKPGSTQPNGQPWPNIVISATFSCTPSTLRYCNQPLTRTDANGNVTTWTYDAAHGGVLTETLPSADGTAPRAQTRHAYAQRNAWIANGSGGYTMVPTPVWLRISTSTCRTSAATGNPASPCATAGDEMLTQYEYGPNGGANTLLLRGQTVTATDDGVTTTLRTCYSYDALGRKISETRPNGTAALASCP
jgi:YD repeat-containing protein